MLILISPTNLEEAKAVAAGGADIVDIKNTQEGSLGANFPWVIKSIVETIKAENITFSATLGDLPYKPGTAALAAYGAAHAGARYIKAGMYGTKTINEASEVMLAVRKSCDLYDPSITVVTAGYADYRRINGLSPSSLVKAARASSSNVVMVDTAIKDGKSLIDNMSLVEIKDFVEEAHDANLAVALAGSVRTADLESLFHTGADIIGVRGAVCDEGDRTTSIKTEAVSKFMEEVLKLKRKTNAPAAS